MTIEITIEDIQQGRRCDAWNCPIKRAIDRATGQENYWTVGMKALHGLNGENITMPESMRDWRMSFDYDWGVQPAVFEVDALAAQTAPV